MLKLINKITYILSMISTIVFMVLLIKFDILPFKYLTLIIIGTLLLYIVFTCTLIKNKKKFISIIQIILEIIIIIGTCLGSYVIYKTDKFLNNLNKVVDEEYEYYVIVKETSKYDSIYDLENKLIGTYSNNDKEYDGVIDRIKEVVSSNYFNSSDLFTASDKLLSEEIDALVITSFHYDMLCEKYNDYENLVRIIYIDGVVIERPIEEVKAPTESSDVFTIYISGIDTGGSIYRVSRSDVNILVTVNTKTHEVLFTNIPRDYYVQLHGTTGNRDKLTHAGIYGINMSITTIEDLLNIRINYYVRVNFDTLIKVIDTIGGIDLYSDMAFSLTWNKYVTVGMNHFNAQETLLYARSRYQFASGDRKRGEHQEDIIEAIIKKVTSSETLLTNYFNILEDLQYSFQTSFPQEMIKSLVKDQLDTKSSWTIKRINLDGYDSYNYTYSMPGWWLYVMVPYQDLVDRASFAINGMRQGKTFSELGI